MQFPDGFAEQVSALGMLAANLFNGLTGPWQHEAGNRRSRTSAQYVSKISREQHK
jgi:hypothetical protein